jgi:hypothetical protein
LLIIPPRIVPAGSIEETAQRLDGLGGGGSASFAPSDVRARQGFEMIKQVASLVNSVFGVRRRILVRPFLMCMHPLFSNGIVFEMRGPKRVVVARGGR